MEAKQFNFTYAIPDGAWVKDSAGNAEWHHFDYLYKHFGREWVERQMRAQGMFTGCWVDVR